MPDEAIPMPDAVATADDAYPAHWLTPAQAATVRAAHTRDLAAQLDQLTHDELLDAVSGALARKTTGQETAP